MSRLLERIPAAVLAAALGAALRAQVIWVSASPRTLVEAGLGAGVGLSVGLSLRLDGSGATRVGVALLGGVLGAALTLWLPWPPAAFATACALAGLAAALPRPRWDAGALLLAAPALLTSFFWPLAGALLLGAAGVAAARWREGTTPEASTPEGTAPLDCSRPCPGRPARGARPSSPAPGPPAARAATPPRGLSRCCSRPASSPAPSGAPRAPGASAAARRCSLRWPSPAGRGSARSPTAPPSGFILWPGSRILGSSSRR
ncbi:MAG: hypothetical protein H6741_07810 [Alphaproteobacteria bacterium]|nr:hypothetical protein [Alphaproteobacteria bacterium]